MKKVFQKIFWKFKGNSVVTMPPKQRRHVKIEVEASPPENWDNLYENIREMRKDKSAPVDTVIFKSFSFCIFESMTKCFIHRWAVKKYKTLQTTLK